MDDDEVFGTPTSLKSKSSGKMVNDPVHGHFTLPNYVIKVVDTPQFQRLRDLKQLGTTYYVFPGASHNRFEHCLGVSHLAGKLLKYLDKNQPELELKSRDHQLVSIAGLCHDLGHGPFSHAFEEWIHRVKPEAKWHHEDMSKRMLEHMIDENNLDFDRTDINFIKELIGGHPSNNNREKRFLFDIVANMRNSVDVDKFDYLARDCLNLGIKSSYDYSRLLKFARVIDNEICFHSKEVYNIYEMFHTRYSMHKQVYTHRVGKAIEYMISDAMALADPYLGISKAIEDPSEYTLLTDSILHTIESSKMQELGPAKAIIKNIRCRKLYKFADEMLIPPERWEQLLKIKESDIVAFSNELKLDDIIINVVSMNYAMKERNPVDSVKFYTKWDDNESFTIPKENVSLLIPDQFSEKYIRIFTRDPAKVKIAQTAFRAYCTQFNFKPSPAHSLPNSTQSPYVSPSNLETVRKKLRLSYGENM